MELVTNEASGNFKTSCTIKMDREVVKAHEFFAITYDPTTGEHKVHRNCDAVTAGIAFRLAAKAFKDMYDELSPKDKAAVDSIFNPDGVPK